VLDRRSASGPSPAAARSSLGRLRLTLGISLCVVGAGLIPAGSVSAAPVTKRCAPFKQSVYYFSAVRLTRNGNPDGRETCTSIRKALYDAARARTSRKWVCNVKELSGRDKVTCVIGNRIGWFASARYVARS